MKKNSGRPFGSKAKFWRALKKRAAHLKSEASSLDEILQRMNVVGKDGRVWLWPKLKQGKKRKSIGITPMAQSLKKMKLT